MTRTTPPTFKFSWPEIDLHGCGAANISEARRAAAEVAAKRSPEHLKIVMETDPVITAETGLPDATE